MAPAAPRPAPGRRRSLKAPLDKLGSAGALIAAAACPICFPKLALLGAFLGLGGLAAYEAQLFIAAQALVVLAVAGHVLAYRRAPRAWRFGLALAGGGAFFAALYLFGSELLSYLGLGALIAASLPRLRRPPAA
ncbi:MAG TPA: MerC family mercury resistance protein [Burkholderiales bacterium]